MDTGCGRPIIRATGSCHKSVRQFKSIYKWIYYTSRKNFNDGTDLSLVGNLFQLWLTRWLNARVMQVTTTQSTFIKNNNISCHRETIFNLYTYNINCMWCYFLKTFWENCSGLAPIHLASLTGSREVIEQLLDMGAHIDMRVRVNNKKYHELET